MSSNFYRRSKNESLALNKASSKQDDDMSQSIRNNWTLQTCDDDDRPKNSAVKYFNIEEERAWLEKNITD